jgi:hypothetical protein
MSYELTWIGSVLQAKELNSARFSVIFTILMASKNIQASKKSVTFDKKFTINYRQTG